MRSYTNYVTSSGSAGGGWAKDFVTTVQYIFITKKHDENISKNISNDHMHLRTTKTPKNSVLEVTKSVAFVHAFQFALCFSCLRWALRKYLG